MVMRNMGPSVVQIKRGEEIELTETYAVIKQKGIPHPYGRFAIMNAHSMVQISEMNLSALQYRIFLRLVGEMGIGNMASINQAGVAKAYGVTRQSVNEAFAALREHNLIRRREDHGQMIWEVNAEHAWKGTTRGLKACLPARRTKLRSIKGGKAESAMQAG